MRALAGRVAHALPDGWRICGENTYGRHSIAYDRLPSYFQLFAVYDEHDTCLSWDDTEAWAARLGVDLVPVLYRGPFVHATRVRAARRRLGLRARARGRRAALGGGVPASPSTSARSASSSARDHVKTDQHWMHGEVTANGLARDA